MKKFLLMTILTAMGTSVFASTNMERNLSALNSALNISSVVKELDKNNKIGSLDNIAFIRSDDLVVTIVFKFTTGMSASAKCNLQVSMIADTPDDGVESSNGKFVSNIFNSCK